MCEQVGNIQAKNQLKILVDFVQCLKGSITLRG